jgi:tetratricopeptide (TPR) repeat protein
VVNLNIFEFLSECNPFCYASWCLNPEFGESPFLKDKFFIPKGGRICNINNSANRSQKRRDLFMRVMSVLILLTLVFILSSKGQENNADYWVKRGIDSEKNQSFNEAIIYFERAISIDPSCAEAWYWKGYTFEDMDNPESPNISLNKEAITCFETAIKINPPYVDAYIDLGFCQAQIGMYDEALKSVNKALEMDPNNSGAMDVKGIVFYYLRDYDESIKWHDKAINVDPNNSDAWYNEARTYKERASQGDDEKAAKAFEKASELDAKKSK